ncbi:MAG: sensor histidine kinase, partial [Planctomycetota bacterium]
MLPGRAPKNAFSESTRYAANTIDQIIRIIIAQGANLCNLEVCDCLGDVIRDTRTLTFDLNSPILYELGFETAGTEWLDKQIRVKHEIQTEIRDDGQPKQLDNDIRAILFHNVWELLINVVKHTKARKVEVSVSKVDGQICVIIEGDGVDFEPAKIGSNTGFG